MTALNRRCPWGVSVAVLLLLQPWLAVAQGTQGPQGTAGVTGVGILATGPSRPAIERLRAQLKAVDLRPVVLGAAAEATSDAALRALALGSRVRAGLTLLAGATRIELWQLTPPANVQRESLTHGEDESDDQLMQRAVETLRARLLPLPALAPQPPADQAAPDVSGAFALRLAAGPTLSPGGLNTMGHLWLTPSLDLRSWLRLELALVFPLSSPTVEGPEGAADVYLGLATAGVRFMLGPQRWILRPSLAAGVGASFTHMRGQAVAPLTSETDWVVSAVGHTGGGLSLRLPWRLHLHLDALVGVALPQPAVGFSGRSAAAWGQPFVALNLGLGVRL